MRKAFVMFLAAPLLICGPTGARAQVPPTPAEIAAYSGIQAAAAQGDWQSVASYAKDKALREARDSRGRTAAHIAAHAGHREVLRALARAGADLNALDSDKYDVVTIAAVRDDVPFLDLALSLGASAKNVTSPYDGTALIAAAHLGHDGVVKSLIKAGAPLDHVNNLRWTAVIEAVILGDGGPRHQASLKALVDAGANISIADKTGVTPMQLAQSRGFAEMVDILKSAPRR